MCHEDKADHGNGADGCFGGWSEKAVRQLGNRQGLGSVLKDFPSVTIKSQQTLLFIHSGVSFNI